MNTVTMKVWEDTLAKLKLLAALRRKTMLSVLDELVTTALQEEDHRHFDQLKAMIEQEKKS